MKKCQIKFKQYFSLGNGAEKGLYMLNDDLSISSNGSSYSAAMLATCAAVSLLVSVVIGVALKRRSQKRDTQLTEVPGEEVEQLVLE